MATTTASSKSTQKAQRVFGTVRDKFQRPLAGVTVRVSGKGMRSTQTLGEATTDATGAYVVDYTPTGKAGSAIIIAVWQDAKTLLKECPAQYNPPVSLQFDIDLGGKSFTGPSEFEELVAAITPQTDGTALADLTETSQQQDISFIVQKTGLSREKVEMIAMSSRYEKLTTISAAAWFAALDGMRSVRKTRADIKAAGADFETRVNSNLDKLMHTAADKLATTITNAAEGNIIPLAITADLLRIRQQISDQQLVYAKAHPGTGQASALYQKAALAGLQGADLEFFVQAANNHSGTEQSLWTNLQTAPTLAANKNMTKAKAVFNLSRLTNNNLDLTTKLVQSNNINNPDDLRQFAAHEAADWETILQNNKVTVADPKATATQLETAFTREFPTAAFAARLDKDKTSQLPNRDKVSKFLQQNQQFDLADSRIGQFLQDNKDAAPAADAPVIADQLRRIQRMYRLAPDYKSATTLLNNNIHSAQQIHKMGQENFVNTVGPQLGTDTATQIFQQASQVHSAAVAVIGNMKSLADASSIKAFPNFAQGLATHLTVEIPSLDSLFGNSALCDCDECSSVYGAPAYLADLLHFLDQRASTLPAVGNNTAPTAKDVLLQRRPDIAVIDLECNNSNTEVPYIDIACEIMEDYIAAPVVTLPSAFFPPSNTGPLDNTIPELISLFNAAGQTDVANLLTSSATLEPAFHTRFLQADNSVATFHNQLIRDSQIVLQLTLADAAPPTSAQIRRLHQTLLPSDLIGANPEYTNIPVYNLLKAAKRPFNLPFDLFQTEGELYLGQLGFKRADLINLFAPNNTSLAYAALGVNNAEQNLIFRADPGNQALYWGSLSTATAIQADIFEDQTGLLFQQILDLLSLTFINPAKDSTIQSQAIPNPANSNQVIITADLTKKLINNLTTTKLDAIHRFLRLWRKTSFAMTELDAIVMSIGKGFIDPAFAYQLQQLIALGQSLQLSTYQLLAFYGNIDTLYNGTDCLYNQLFQNKALTNPVNPDLSIANVRAGNTNVTPVHQSLVAGVLQISVNDLNLLLPTNTKLTLAALSNCYRYAQLAQALGLSIADLLKVVNIIDAQPFADPASTNIFMQKYRLLQSSGFSLDDLYYVFFHQDNASQSMVPSADTVNNNLGQLQTDLLTVRSNATPLGDPNGLQLSTWLSDPVLNWDNGLKNKLTDLLNTVDDGEYQQKLADNTTFLLNLRVQYGVASATANLAALPRTASIPAIPITIPANLASQLSFNATTKQLRLAGVLGAADLAALKALSNDAAWQAALAQLTTPATPSAATANTPTNVFFATAADINAVLKGLTGGQAVNRFAFFLGRIAPLYTQALQQSTLINDISSWFNTNTAFVTQLLQSVPAIYTDLTADSFVNKVAAINNPAGAFPNQATRYQSLAKICFIGNKLAMSTAALAHVLTFGVAKLGMLDLLNLPLTPQPTVGDPTSAPAPQPDPEPGPLPGGLPGGEPGGIPGGLPGVENSIRRSAVPLPPVIFPFPSPVPQPPVELPADGPVPVPPTDGVPLILTGFTAFGNLYNLLKFEKAYPSRTFIQAGATVPLTWTVYDILQDAMNDLGSNNDVGNVSGDLAAEMVNLAPDWNSVDATFIANALFTSITDVQAMGYRLMTLVQAMQTTQQLGVPTTTVINWCASGYTSDISNSVKQAVRAKYSDADWITVSTNLQNTLRNQKRDALVAYLLANPGTQTWKTTNDLFDYFLIDMEMCSCQPTSRIVQASNSIQLFVQRCFMQLESLVVVNTKATATVPADSGWLQWQWMKQFRLWQANVKVFLYPENYIEPELLPSNIKSSFLTDLQGELLQNQVTPDSAQEAFSNYLRKLDSVAKLEIKGMWHDQVNSTLHVIGRTFGGNPRIFYYRRLINNIRWTPWEKVDLSIDSEQIVPVVYNNRVYLFWGVVTEVGDPMGQGVYTVPVPSTSTNSNQILVTTPAKQWQIQLAMSEYKDGKWAEQRISANDSTGRIVIPQSGFNPANFLFAPMDIPNFDYDNIFDATGHPKDAETVFNQKNQTAVSANGTLVIVVEGTLIQAGGVIGGGAGTGKEGIAPIGGFILDPVKGYPVTVPVSYSANFIKKPTEAIRNMLQLQSQSLQSFHTVKPANGNFLAPDSSKGIYRNLMSWQMGVADRLGYLTTIFFTGANATNTCNLLNIGSDLPHFYQDNLRTYFVEPSLGDNANLDMNYEEIGNFEMIDLGQGQAASSAYQISIVGTTDGLLSLNRFINFHHPQVAFFLKQLFVGGTDLLMDRTTQLKGDVAYDTDPNKFNFATYLSPDATVYSGAGAPVTFPNAVVDNTPGYPKDDVDFSLRGGYGLYNWEVFFHAPLMVAEHLSLHQQFDEADRWYKYIFNPTDTSAYPAPNKYWNTKPFFLTSNQDYFNESIQGLLNGINAGSTGNTSSQPSLLTEVSDWRNNPFQPHLIAETRTVAYQKVAVMKYIGHLIRYGDYLFNQDTMESVAQATQLYVLASEILGPKPESIPSAVTTKVKNYFELQEGLDAMSDALVDVENLLPFQSVQGYNGVTPTGALPNLQTLYFCIPMNENLVGSTGAWDVVADRLFKIRHCQDINGNFAPLALFAPVINPALLVQATAAGLDLGSILNDLNAPLPLYRFAFMAQKALEIASEVKSLGGGLLAALEKKDAEAAGLLRVAQETKLTTAVLQVKQQQITDAQSTIRNLTRQSELITIRKEYYSGLLNTGISDRESSALAFSGTALDKQKILPFTEGVAAAMHAIPNFNSGVSGLGSPVATLAIGGIALGAIAETASSVISAQIGQFEKEGSITAVNASYERRAQEWQFQVDTADKELEQVREQIAGAKVRLAIANQDLANQQLQIDQAKETDTFLRTKYTNEDLYSYMITQVSNTYFKSYQLAYAIAKQAERNFRYELAIDDSSYIKFGYWDSLHKGLLAGEQLFFDLKNMEMAYYQQNIRELELTKPISLSQLDAVALQQLRTTGECWINLPEELFDMDYPGHYMRRIRSVSITIPCIAGPYTTVSCELTMTKNSVRTSGVSTADAGQYPRKTSNGFPADDPRFRDSVGALQSIATSNAQNDSGLFEVNFRDERYLPFEGAGAISLWHIKLPAAVRQFDFNTISDLVINLKYTARSGGDALAANASANINTRISNMLVSTKDKGLTRIFSAKNDLANEWYRFLNPVNATADQVLSLTLDNTRFPLFVQGKTIKISAVELIADSAGPIALNVISPANDSTAANLGAGAYQPWISASADFSGNQKNPGAWQIVNPAANKRLISNSVADGSAITVNNIVIIVHYQIS